MLKFAISAAALASAIATAAPAFADHKPSHFSDDPQIGNPNQDFELENRDLVVRDSANTVRVRIDSGTGNYTASTAAGARSVHIDEPGANLFLGGSGSNAANDDGDIVLFSETATDQQTSNASIHLDGGEGLIRLGGGGETGQMVLRNPAGDQHILLDGGDALAVVGNTGQRGRLELRNAQGNATVDIDGAEGRLRAEQIISRANGRGGAEGIDSASVLIESRNPALAFRDTTGGNQTGWYVQTGSTGRLLFQAGTTSGLGETVLVLEPDGSVCLGNCN
jgi:hypothetical protein